MGDFMHKMRMVKVHKDAQSFSDTRDLVVEEQRIAFYLNGNKLLSVMSLPNAQDAHFVGFLMGEGVLDCVDDIISLEVAKDGLSVHMRAYIREDKLSHLHKEKTLTTGCCVGVSANFDGEITQKYISSPMRISAQSVFTLLDRFNKKLHFLIKQVAHIRQCSCVSASLSARMWGDIMRLIRLLVKRG